MKFAMFFAGEFLHAFTVSVLTAVLFLGGWRGPGAEQANIGGYLLGFGYLMLKSVAVYFLIMLIRNTLPRLRIDQMMNFNWKFLVPLSMVNVLVVAFVAKLLPPDTAGAMSVYNNGGLLGFFYGALNPAFFAELPRGIALLLANGVMFLVMNNLLHRYVGTQRRGLVNEPPAHAEAPSSGHAEPATMHAGR